MNLQELVARLAELTAELARVEAAIKAFSSVEPVKIWTWKNLRNTSCVTTQLEKADRLLMVFSDKSLTTPADESAKGGWVLRSAWEQYKLAHPEMLGRNPPIGER